MMRLLLLATFVTFTLNSCLCGGDDDMDMDVSIPMDCFETIIPSQTDFESHPDQVFALNSSSVDGDFLKLRIGISGCDLNRDFKLLVSPVKAKTQPPQQEAKLSFLEQACSAFFLVDVCFDVSNLERPTVLKIRDGNQLHSISLD